MTPRPRADDIYKRIADDIRTEQRKLSPHYPTAEEATLRLFNRRATIIGRLCLGGVVLAALGLFTPCAMQALGVGFLAAGLFVVTCAISGNRNRPNRALRGD